MEMETVTSFDSNQRAVLSNWLLVALNANIAYTRCGEVAGWKVQKRTMPATFNIGAMLEVI